MMNVNKIQRKLGVSLGWLISIIFDKVSEWSAEQAKHTTPASHASSRVGHSQNPRSLWLSLPFLCPVSPSLCFVSILSSLSSKTLMLHWKFKLSKSKMAGQRKVPATKPDDLCDRWDPVEKSSTKPWKVTLTSTQALGYTCACAHIYTELNKHEHFFLFQNVALPSGSVLTAFVIETLEESSI